VLTAIAHQEPDRAPIQIYVTPEIDRVLRDHFSPASYIEEFEVDFRTVAPVPFRAPRAPEAGSRISCYDEWGVGYEVVANNAGGTYLEARDLALARLQTMDDVENYPWPDPDDYDYSVIPAQIDAAGEFAVCLGHAGIPDIINGVGRGRGMEQVLTDIITGDEVGVAIIDRRVDFYYEWCRRALEAGGGRIDILCLGEDLGSQKGPTMSPATFDAFFRPRLQRFFDLGHRYGCRVMLHSCGSTRMLQPRLIEMGLDVLDAVQPEPEGMDPEELKREFGSRLTFCGMISTQHTLPHGTPEQCRAEARHRIDVIGRGGGYIFAPAHAIQPDTPLENILAIYEEATGKRFS
jgi:Uroporphyrinogen-III decarboxylase